MLRRSSSFSRERAALPFFVLLLFGIPAPLAVRGRASDGSSSAAFDVLHYNAQIEPGIASRTVKGKVLIRFVSQTNDLATVGFDCGELTIETVRENGAPQQFSTRERRCNIALSRPAQLGETREIEIAYHGEPRRGIRFFPDQAQVYTVFATSQWLVCVDAPDDKATLSLNVILPTNLTAVANGRLVSKRELPDKRVAHRWEQNTPIPTYIFGFAAGPFRTVTEKKGRVEFRYLATHFSEDELRRIFHDTADMLEFYEDRAGVRYAGATYTQVLAAGNTEQEMSGFTALHEPYGKQVLANGRDLWLGAHEFSHQWWGNMVTCRDWNHFWLNEGMANFMTAAYIEHRFGRAEYLREIESYRANYEKVRQAGKDKALVFPDWLHPTAEDRRLVYDKGAYVLHLLREELGEQAFWKGMRSYTRAYFGKSVVTADLQAAMEQASGKSLQGFFSRWVYLTE
ncbi:MAG: aminopeptidase [Acidobacteria bacterium]|nr:MAG: aminopeptidase [Acidobacteriota bacterium]